MISRNLTLRLLIAGVFIPLLLWIFHYGGVPFLIFVELLIVLSLWEFLTLTGVTTYLWQRVLLAAVVAYPPLAITYLGTRYLIELSIVAFFLSALPHVFSKKLGEVGKSIGLTLFGLFYLSVGYGSLVQIRSGRLVEPELAGNWVIFLFATIWIVDTAAYYFGWKFGKTKLSPAISPNKTVVGFVGGFVGAILSAGIFNFLFLSSVGFLHLIVPAIVIAFFGQLGDLVESIFKREAGKKDSSNLIPGHGGVLDRFDSLVFAAPALLLYLRFLPS